MTKDQYYEMCEALGSEPLDSEIPVEFEDLPSEVQESLRIYNSMQDSWDYMNGNYIGKNYAGFKDLLEIFSVPIEERQMIFEFIQQIDKLRAKAIAAQKPKK